MPKQKELGKSVILNLSIDVVRTKDVRKILPTAKKDQNMEVKGLSGITWNNSDAYTLLGKEAMFQKIINKSKAIVAGRPDFLVLKIRQTMAESETLEGKFLTEEAVREKCWDGDRDVMITMKDGEKEAARIGISRKNGKTVVKRDTGGLPLPYGEIKRIQLLS